MALHDMHTDHVA